MSKISAKQLIKYAKRYTDKETYESVKKMIEEGDIVSALKKMKRSN